MYCRAMGFGKDSRRGNENQHDRQEVEEKSENASKTQGGKSEGNNQGKGHR